MLEIIIAFYVSGVGIALWQIWLPSYQIIDSLAPNTILAKHPMTTFIVVMIMFILLLPLLIPVILFDDKKEQFINGFVKGAIGKDDRR
jgi:hypothetical protein